MAVTETIRPTQIGNNQTGATQTGATQTGAAQAGGNQTGTGLVQPGAVPARPEEIALQAFRHGRAGEHRLDDLLAFALAVERGQAATPETVERLRHEAASALSDHAFRYLHNSVEQIRRDAVAEQLGRIRKPPGFVALVAANLVALALAGGAAGWLALHPETLAGLAGLFTG